MNRTPDVIVLGAGIIGCAVAYELARRGARVRVIDGREVGRGATQASAGVLAPHIEGKNRRALAELGVRSLHQYDEWVARVVEDSGMAVQYVRKGALEVAIGEGSLDRLEEIAATLAAVGVSTERLDARATREAEPELAESVLGGLLVPAYGFVAAGQLTAALERAASVRGATFVVSRSANRVSSDADAVRVETDAEPLTGGAAVLAAGCWSAQIEVAGAPRLPVRPVRGQLLHLEWPGSPLVRVAWAPRCYLVPLTDGSLLAGATVEEAGFDEQATVAGIRDLLDATCEMVPRAQQAGFRGVRVGLRPGTPDDLPAVGASESLPRLIYATGHFRNGVLLAPLTAELVANLLLEGHADPALASMSPGRFGGC